MSMVWTLIAFVSLWWTVHTVERHIKTTALAQSRIALAKDRMYRVWISHLGGFYTPSDKVAPNPHLSHVPDRDITDSKGRKFTLVNPAYMTRLVYEFSKDSNIVQTHLVSNRLLNPINAPENWEINALNKILEGEKEVYSFSRSDGRNLFRYMVPFITEQSCLKCHARQGYKPGDIRGGISIVTDIDDIISGERNVQMTAVAGYSVLWVLVILLIRIAYTGISRMLTRIENTEKEKLAVNSRNTSILESAGEAIFGVDTGGRITFINHALLSSTGYTEQELTGQNHGILTHSSECPDITQKGNECVIMQTLSDKTTRDSVETFTRKDGSKFSGHLFAAPVVEAGTLTGAVISFFDISDKLKRENDLTNALKEKSMLLNELHHRVKNNLQIVSGILSLQADTVNEDHSDPEDVLRNAQSRVMSMALIHECLYRSNDVSSVNMKQYFNELTAYYRTAYSADCVPIEFITDIDDIAIDNNLIVTCGILINEIVTNSIKHAFRDIDQPRITVRLKQNGDQAVLTIADNGTGIDQNKKQTRDSLGMMLISSLTEQLYGSLQLSVNSGTKYTITFPLKLKN
ncbi:MAG: histidine kinase dimerization/phosphoacceptor domain -containing protein [Deferribacterales bacterium]